MASAATSRTTYNGGTPTTTTFTPAAIALENSSFTPAPRLPSESLPAPTTRPSPPHARSRLQRIYARTVDTLANNVGMLLIAASQGFFSLMNVSVKKLNSIDPPVPAFQVSSSSVVPAPTPDANLDRSRSAHLGPNGEHHHVEPYMLLTDKTK